MSRSQSFLIPGLWIAWLVYWYAAAWRTKASQYHEPPLSQLSHIVPLSFGVMLLFFPAVAGGMLRGRVLPRADGWHYVGAALTAAGLAFAVAARIQLGGNWSGTVTLKQDHTLIRSGPYRWVRHPIYTGLLLAVFGTALAVGEWRGVLAIGFVVAAFLRKIAIEERFMREHFGAAYAEYSREVPALLPLRRPRLHEPTQARR
jgi:protein-S-isoprenylcysteine O-methyltransferase Ste14